MRGRCSEVGKVRGRRGDSDISRGEVRRGSGKV